MNPSSLVRLVAIANVLWALGALAQPVPQRMAFTGNLTNSGAPTMGTHSFIFTLFDMASGGTVAWTETQSLPVNNGVVTTVLGNTTALTPAILNGAPLFLEVSVDGTTLTPRVSIVSVPYAVRAGVASSLGALQPNDVQRRVTGTCTGANAIQTIDAMGNVTCVATAGGAGDITSVTTAAGSGLTGGVASGDAALAVDGTVQRRGAAPNDLACPSGRYVQAISGTGAPTCILDSDTGVNAVNNGAGIGASVAGRTLNISNTGVLAVASANGAITASAAVGTVTLTANFAGTGAASTIARSDHSHPMSCGRRSGAAGASSSIRCGAGEQLVGGGCNTSGTPVTESFPFNDCSPFFCLFCDASATRCNANAWSCSVASGTVTASALCCTTPLQ